MYKKWMKFFQNKVFGIENLKFKFLDKFFPNYLTKIEQNIERKFQKNMAQAKTEEERQNLIAAYKYDLLSLRKEANRKENRNYHFNKNNPYEALFWLNRNKDIHKKGLKRDLIFMPIFIGGAVLSSYINPTFTTLFVAGTVYQTMSLFVNTNCVLLQNYNINRINEYIERVYPKVKQKNLKKAEKLKETTKAVSNAVVQSQSLPTIDEVIESIKTKEEAEGLLELIAKEQNSRQNKGIQKTLRPTRKLERRKA